MRRFPPYDLFFKIFYALLILLVGALVYFMSGRKEILLFLPLLLALYLALSLRKPLRRRRAARAVFSPQWRNFLLAHSTYFRGLGDDGRSRFEHDIRLFLAETRIAAVGGAAVAWETRLLIAAGTAAMLHGRPEWEPPLADGVTVYPGYSFDRNYRPGKGNIAGQAPPRGPLLIAEKSLLEGFAGERDGANVLLHELAHYFDLEARKGGMSFKLGTENAVSWPEIIAGEYERHDFAASLLPAYAAQNEAEFFAVASEMFFENPGPLQEAHPRLFAVLREFYRQDPRTVLAWSRARD
jgi:Mlc titration factor MtfA (ptsG expression regulator)